MANVPGHTEWVSKYIPDVNARAEQFVVNTDEVDDELVEIFISELKRLSGELSNGVQAGNYELVRESAHSIKGMGGTIGLPEISVLGLEIENLAKDEELSRAEPMISALADWLTTLS